MGKKSKKKEHLNIKKSNKAAENIYPITEKTLLAIIIIALLFGLIIGVLGGYWISNSNGIEYTSTIPICRGIYSSCRFTTTLTLIPENATTANIILNTFNQSTVSFGMVPIMAPLAKNIYFYNASIELDSSSNICIQDIYTTNNIALNSTQANEILATNYFINNPVLQQFMISKNTKYDICNNYGAS